MTVLGSGKDKGDDKEILVAKSDVTTVIPNRYRIVKFQRRRTIITLTLSIFFVLILLCSIFLTVCFIKRIGPFRRHFSGHCLIGNRRLNGHRKIFESYEINDKFAAIHVPKFNFKHSTFDSVDTLHIFDKKVTIIQYNNRCFIKPMMRNQVLKRDWYDKVRNYSHQHIQPRYAHFHLRIMHPQMPKDYLFNKIHPLADSMCDSRPVFRLAFHIHASPNQWRSQCNIQCTNCASADKVTTWRVVSGRWCRVCHCKQQSPPKVNGPLTSSNQVDSNCKTIRCENKCANKNLIGCNQCRCADADQEATQRPVPILPIVNEIRLDDFIVNDKEVDRKELPKTSSRSKRAATNNCTVVAKIFEGYTPVDLHAEAPLDYIYEC